MKLPEHLRPLFWSYNFEELDTETVPATVVFQVLQYGTMADWQWLRSIYGKERIQSIIQAAPAHALRPKVKPLVATVF